MMHLQGGGRALTVLVLLTLASLVQCDAFFNGTGPLPDKAMTPSGSSCFGFWRILLAILIFAAGVAVGVGGTLATGVLLVYRRDRTDVPYGTLLDEEFDDDFSARM